jgi:hypothetical protein
MRETASPHYDTHSVSYAYTYPHATIWHSNTASNTKT